MREAGDEARRDEQAVARSHRAQHVADRERRHQPDEQRLARPGGGEQGEQRSPDDDARGVGRDGVPGRRDVDAHAGRDVGQQAHRHELGRADGDPAQDQGEGREGGVAGLGHCVVQRPAPRRAFPLRARSPLRCHTAFMPGRPATGSGQPVSGPPHAEPGEQRRGREVQRGLRPLERSRSSPPAGTPPAGCSPRRSAGRGTGRPAGPRTAPSTAVVGRAAAQSASQAGSVATAPFGVERLVAEDPVAAVGRVHGDRLGPARPVER